MSDPIEAAILEKLAKLGPGKSIEPADVAVHCWFAPPLHVHSTTVAPFLLAAPYTSRHIRVFICDVTGPVGVPVTASTGATAGVPSAGTGAVARGVWRAGGRGNGRRADGSRGNAHP